MATSGTCYQNPAVGKRSWLSRKEAYARLTPAPGKARPSNVYDNAPMESIFATLKTELLHHRNYATRQQAKTDIFEYIEVFYNNQRLHSALGYLTPMAFESLSVPP